MMREGVCVCVCVWLICLGVCDALWLTLPPLGTKCISEDIRTHVIVVGDYVVVSDDHTSIPGITVKVTSPYGNSLHRQENVTFGQFAFTTQESGSYVACFWVTANLSYTGNINVNIEWKTGIAAKDWDSVAKKEKIDGMALEFRKLKGAVDAVRENLLYLKSKEAEMRAVSEKTNARVAWLSVMSLGVCIVAGGLQVWHLKRYFQKKKMI